MRTLNCNEFDDRLAAAVAERTPVPPGLAAHAADCPRCAAAWEEHLLIDRLAGQWAEDVPEVDLADRILERWRAEQSVHTVGPAAKIAGVSKRGTSRLSAGSRRFAVVAAVTAVVLLLAVPVFLTPDSAPVSSQDGTAGTVPGRQRREATRDDERPRPPHVPAGEDAGGVRGLVGDFRAKYDGMTRNVSTLVASVKRELPSLSLKLDPLDGGPGRKQPPDERKPAAWRAGWDPIQKDVRKAFGFLQETVPDWDPPST